MSTKIYLSTEEGISLSSAEDPAHAQFWAKKITYVSLFDKVAELIDPFESSNVFKSDEPFDEDIVKTDMSLKTPYLQSVSILRYYRLIDDNREFPINDLVNGRLCKLPESRDITPHDWSTNLHEALADLGMSAEDHSVLIDRCKNSVSNLSQLFSALFRYRTALFYHYIMRGSSSIRSQELENVKYLFPVFETIENDYVIPLLAYIDNVLNVLLGRDMRPVTVGELIENYGYPLEIY